MWTNDVVLRLIELFRSYKCLWDTTNNDYKNKNKKRGSWEEIAEIMGMSREVVETKIHNLRSQFTRERKKVDASKRQGNEDVKQTFWFAYEPLMFLIKEETTPNAIDTLMEQKDPQDSQSSNMSEIEANYEMNQLLEITQDYHAATLANSSRKRAAEEKINKPCRIITETKRKKMDDKVTRDEFDIYAEYIASELRNIKSEEEVIMAKSCINNILLDARLRSIRKSATNSGTSNRSDDEDHSKFVSPDLAEQEENSSVLVKIESFQ